MALSTLGGKLLLVGGRLAQSLACCCTRWCRRVGSDVCGNPVYDCGTQQQGSVGPCTPACKPPVEPCDCGPDIQCPVCYECIDRKCVRIEDCCADGSPCPPCQQCVDGACVPCGECEQCVDGICLPCGECQKCVGGECVPCDAGEVCIGGVCVPKQYYCCWDSCADKLANNNNTTCTQATVSGSSQTNPCGADNTTGGCGSLTKSGPHATSQLCSQECQRYECVPDACGNNHCVPAADGPYPSRSACLAACDDPCNSPCTFSGANAPGVYDIDGCERDICVSYSSLESRPIRVQIWGPIMENGCPVPDSRVIKSDSDWRGEACCDCPEDRPQGDLEGGPKGQITWTKPEGATWFEVYVFFPCANDSTYELDIKCDGDCDDLTEPASCPCEGDGDCAGGCHCCDGECQAEPCAECVADEDCPEYPCGEENQFVNDDRCCPPGYTHPSSSGTDCCTDDTETDCVPSVGGVVCCDGVCQAAPCCTETECRLYVHESGTDDDSGSFFEENIGTCAKSEELKEALGEINGVQTWRYTTLVTIDCACRDSFEAATGPMRGDNTIPIDYEVVPCAIWCCEVDEDNNPTGNCFLSEAEGQDCAQGVQYASEAACLEGCNPPP